MLQPWFIFLLMLGLTQFFPACKRKAISCIICLASCIVLVTFLHHNLLSSREDVTFYSPPFPRIAHLDYYTICTPDEIEEPQCSTNQTETQNVYPPSSRPGTKFRTSASAVKDHTTRYESEATTILDLFRRDDEHGIACTPPVNNHRLFSKQIFERLLYHICHATETTGDILTVCLHNFGIHANLLYIGLTTFLFAALCEDHGTLSIWQIVKKSIALEIWCFTLSWYYSPRRLLVRLLQFACRTSYVVWPSARPILHCTVDTVLVWFHFVKPGLKYAAQTVLKLIKSSSITICGLWTTFVLLRAKRSNCRLLFRQQVFPKGFHRRDRRHVQLRKKKNSTVQFWEEVGRARERMQAMKRDLAAANRMKRELEVILEAATKTTHAIEEEIPKCIEANQRIQKTSMSFRTRQRAIDDTITAFKKARSVLEQLGPLSNDLQERTRLIEEIKFSALKAKTSDIYVTTELTSKHEAQAVTSAAVGVLPVDSNAISISAIDADTDAVDGDADAVDGDADAVDGDADAVDGDADAVDGDADAVDADADAVKSSIVQLPSTTSYPASTKAAAEVSPSGFVPTHQQEEPTNSVLFLVSNALTGTDDTQSVTDQSNVIDQVSRLEENEHMIALEAPKNDPKTGIDELSIQQKDAKQSIHLFPFVVPHSQIQETAQRASEPSQCELWMSSNTSLTNPPQIPAFERIENITASQSNLVLLTPFSDTSKPTLRGTVGIDIDSAATSVLEPMRVSDSETIAATPEVPHVAFIPLKSLHVDSNQDDLVTYREATVQPEPLQVDDCHDRGVSSGLTGTDTPIYGPPADGLTHQDLFTTSPFPPALRFPQAVQQFDSPQLGQPPLQSYSRLDLLTGPHAPPITYYTNPKIPSLQNTDYKPSSAPSANDTDAPSTPHIEQSLSLLGGECPPFFLHDQAVVESNLNRMDNSFDLDEIDDDLRPSGLDDDEPFESTSTTQMYNPSTSPVASAFADPFTSSLSGYFTDQVVEDVPMGDDRDLQLNREEPWSTEGMTLDDAEDMPLNQEESWSTEHMAIDDAEFTQQDNGELVFSDDMDMQDSAGEQHNIGEPTFQTHDQEMADAPSQDVPKLQSSSNGPPSYGSVVEIEDLAGSNSMDVDTTPRDTDLHKDNTLSETPFVPKASASPFSFSSGSMRGLASPASLSKAEKTPHHAMSPADSKSWIPGLGDELPPLSNPAAPSTPNALSNFRKPVATHNFSSVHLDPRAAPKKAMLIPKGRSSKFKGPLTPAPTKGIPTEDFVHVQGCNPEFKLGEGCIYEDGEIKFPKLWLVSYDWVVRDNDGDSIGEDWLEENGKWAGDHPDFVAEHPSWKRAVGRAIGKYEKDKGKEMRKQREAREQAERMRIEGEELREAGRLRSEQLKADEEKEKKPARPRSEHMNTDEEPQPEISDGREIADSKGEAVPKERNVEMAKSPPRPLPTEPYVAVGDCDPVFVEKNGLMCVDYDWVRKKKEWLLENGEWASRHVEYRSMFGKKQGQLHYAALEKYIAAQEKAVRGY